MRRKLYQFFMAFLAVASLSCAAHAGVYYIDDTGDDSTGVGVSTNPWQTLTKLKASTSGCGDTWILKNGTYTLSGHAFNPTTLPSCASWSSSNTIRAENNFQAVVTVNSGLKLGGAADSTNATYYNLIEGLVWDSTSYQKMISGHHITMSDVWFIGGPPTGNNANLAIGHNNFAGEYGATDVLIQRFMVLGSTAGSARYGVSAFNAANSLIKQGVIHMNNGYTCGACGNPSAHFNIYNSKNVFGMNIIGMDDQNDPPDFFQGSLYVTANGSTGAVGTTDTSGYYGCLALNNADYASRMDGNLDISSFTYRNVVGIDNSEGGITMGTGSTQHSVTLANITLINSSVTPNAAGIATYGGGGTKSIINAIVSGFSNDQELRSVSATYHDCYNSGTCGGGTGQVTYNPLTNGASTWLRIEPGSALKTAGSGGGQIGAEIKYKLGADYVRYGETDWDQPTSSLLWPWTNEGSIKTRMCMTYSADFCGSTYTALSLTQYVHARGNAPTDYYEADTSSPSAPTNISTSAASSSSLTWTWTASTDTVGVAAYEVDLSTMSDFSVFTGSYNDLNVGNVTSYQTTGLSASTTYYFRARGKDAAGNTSASSSTGQATTSAASVPPANIPQGYNPGSGHFRGGGTYR